MRYEKLAEPNQATVCVIQEAPQKKRPKTCSVVCVLVIAIFILSTIFMISCLLSSYGTSSYKVFNDVSISSSYDVKSNTPVVVLKVNGGFNSTTAISHSRPNNDQLGLWSFYERFFLGGFKFDKEKKSFAQLNDWLGALEFNIKRIPTKRSDEIDPTRLPQGGLLLFGVD